jgi:hypothetical protein
MGKKQVVHSVTVLTLLAISCAKPSPASANSNLVTNGGLEDGNFTAWTRTGNANILDTAVIPNANIMDSPYLPNVVHSGTYAAALAPLIPLL